ncbi:TPR-like protein [Wolfiporia cocos MD-104 SS10]|uniref:TPR-like protein n=1 Tax=Wolfiporia cocos (strain MD-104) TaxID=742152 RepID=A0A2H3JR74_WOLCO|nr:TPR-like protein [Wolfiporia cocos MD-104 SS10]
MVRAKTKSKKTAPAISAEGTSTAPPSIAALIEKAQSLVDQCDYELAQRFVNRILEREQHHIQARELLGVIQLETGDLDSAKSTFETLIPPSPSAASPPLPSAYLYLAQLSDDPQQAFSYYEGAYEVLVVQLKGKERAVDSATSTSDETELKQTIVRTLISMVELYMDPSYDLCSVCISFLPGADVKCEELLKTALDTDPGNAEALQTLASVRLSQSRPDDAKVCLEQAWTAWKDLDPDDARMPPISARIALVKLFLELALYTPALLVLQGVMASDDQEVEAWYLEGWCFFLMAEQAQEAGGALDGLAWGELARDARDCLETCQMLHVNQEHPDQPLLEHARELIAKLEALGVQPSPEEDEDEGDADGWEDVEGSDDEDGDVEMS